MDDAKILISKLRAVGMSQKDIAAAVQLSQSAISHIAVGRRTDVRISTYNKLKDLHDSKVNQLAPKKNASQ